MSRALAVIDRLLAAVRGMRRAPMQIDTSVRQLARDELSKVRLAAALALSKSRDPRAVHRARRAR